MTGRHQGSPLQRSTCCLLPPATNVTRGRFTPRNFRHSMCHSGRECARSSRGATVGLSVQSSLGKSPLVPSVLGFLLFFACLCRSGVPLKTDIKFVCAWILSLLQLLHEVRPERQHAPSASACLHMIHSLAQLAGARATKSAEWPSKNLHWHGLLCPRRRPPSAAPRRQCWEARPDYTLV